MRVLRGLSLRGAAARLGVVVVLSVSLPLANPTHAAALDLADFKPAVQKVGTALNSPPGRALTTVGRVGAYANPLGTVAAIGILAYETKDTWAPIVSDLWGKLSEGSSEEDSSASATQGCSVAIYGLNPQPTGELTGAIQWTTQCVQTYSVKDYYVQYRNLQCTLGDGSVTPVDTALKSSVRASAGYQDTAIRNFSVVMCGAGQSIASVDVRGRFQFYTHTSYSNWTTLVTPWSPQNTEQTTEVVCTHPDGTSTTITSTSYGQTDRVGIPSCRQRWPDSAPTSGTVNVGPKGGALRPIQSWQTDPTVFPDYPECFGAFGALQCKIRVFVDGNPCTVGEGPCTYWRALANDELTADRVECRFGQYAVPLFNCNPLRRAYDPATGTQTVRDLDEEGAPIPRPDWEPVPDPKPNPNPTPAPQPTPPPGAPGGDPVPNPTPNPAGDDPATNPNSTSCMGEAASWNPVHWVFVPIKCALRWAFVPTSAPPFSDVPSPLPPGWVPDLSGIPASACGPVTFPSVSFGDFAGVSDTSPTQILSTCSEPWSTLRLFTYNGLLAGLLVTAAWRFFKAVTSGAGMGVSTGDGED